MNSTTPNDGGPAFPTKMPASDPRTVGFYTNEGMTLRDWFAGQALKGMVNGFVFDQPSEDMLQRQGIKPDEFEKFAAYLAYKFADAMLEERSKTQ